MDRRPAIRQIDKSLFLDGKSLRYGKNRVKGQKETYPPPVLKKESFENKISGKEEGSHGVQGGEIWIIILRRWFFHGIGPVLGDRNGKMLWFSFLLGGIPSQASPCGT